VRFAVAKLEGLTEERVALVADGFADSELSDIEKAVIRYTDVFLAGGRGRSDDERVAIEDHLDEGQIVELTAGIALFMGFSKIAISLGQAPDDMPTMVVATPDWIPADG
jgi:alkylhydroperoxidase family enzyme